jgi:hypothetical protein
MRSEERERLSATAIKRLLAVSSQGIDTPSSVNLWGLRSEASHLGAGDPGGTMRSVAAFARSSSSSSWANSGGLVSFTPLRRFRLPLSQRATTLLSSEEDQDCRERRVLMMVLLGWVFVVVLGVSSRRAIRALGWLKPPCLLVSELTTESMRDIKAV